MSFKKNIVKAYPGQEPFWGKYTDLNKVSVPGLKDIQEYQLKKISEFQDQATQNTNKTASRLNELFKTGKINSLPEKYAKETDQKLDEILTNIVKGLNATYAGNKTKEEGYKYEVLSKNLMSLKNILLNMNNMLQRGGQKIPEHYLQSLENAIQACGLKGLNDNILDEWFKDLNNYKGALIEDIGVSWLSLLEIPNISTINTGALNLQGTTISEGRHKGQLIQDLMMIECSSPELLKINISYKPIGSNKMITTTLDKFFKAMEQASGQSKQIIISDEGYSTLLELSRLNIQAKAGLNQKPWNENKSTQISIGEFNQSDGLVVSAKRTFQLLNQLDQEPDPKTGIWVKNTSKDYNMLADYGLSTVLFKILHLNNKDGNQYLLTPQGFITYNDRIKQLMEKRKSRIYLKGAVSINENTLGTKYQVGMTNYN